MWLRGNPVTHEEVFQCQFPRTPASHYSPVLLSPVYFGFIPSKLVNYRFYDYRHLFLIERTILLQCDRHALVGSDQTIPRTRST